MNMNYMRRMEGAEQVFSFFVVSFLMIMETTHLVLIKNLWNEKLFSLLNYIMENNLAELRRLFFWQMAALVDAS